MAMMIAIAVVVENSGEGAHWAAPIASFIVEKYLKGSISTRESGITPEYFMNANRLPDLTTYSHKLLLKMTHADSLKKLKQDSVNKVKGLKSVFIRNGHDTAARLLTARSTK